MSHLLPRESWTADRRHQVDRLLLRRPRRGPGRDADAEATDRAKENAIEFVERDLSRALAGRGADGAFDWERWWTATAARARPASTPSTGAPTRRPGSATCSRRPGSVEHRLPSGDSGFANLKLAGDWTRNGVDGGCVEAAVISGMDAARAITGDQRRDPRQRAPTGLQPQARELPAYVEYGGRATAPSPFSCEDGQPAGAAAARRRRAHRRARRDDVQRPGRPRGRVPRARLERDAADRRVRARDLADPRRSTAGARCARRRPPSGSRCSPAATWADVRGRAAAAGRALRVRRQPDVLPGRARDVRLRQDDGPLRPARRPRRSHPHAGVRRQLRPQRGRRLARLPRRDRRGAAAGRRSAASAARGRCR